MDPLENNESIATKFKKRFVLVRQRKKNILLFTLAGILLAAAISFIQPRLFKAISRITFKYDSIYNSALNKSGSLDNEISSIKSEENILFVKKNLGISKNIRDNIEIKEDVANSSLMIKAISNDPQQSADIANDLTELFLGKAVIKNRGPYLTLLSELTKREKENSDKILRNIKNYQEFLSNAEIKNLNPGDLIVVNQIADLESELEIIEYDNKLNQLILNDLISFWEKKFPDIDSKTILISNNKIDNLRNAFERALTEKIIFHSTQNIKDINIVFPWKKSYYDLNTDSLNTLLNNYTSNYVDVNLKKNILDNFLLKNLIWKIEETKIKISSIDLSKSILYDLITGLEEKFSAIPIRYIEVAQLERTKKFNLKLDKKIKIKKAQLRKEAEKYFAEIDSIAKAEVPRSFFSPNIFNNILLGTIAGFLFGMVLTFFSAKKKLEFISSIEDIEDAPFQVISQIHTFPHGLPLLLKTHSSTENENSEIIKSAFESIEAFLKFGNLEKVLKSVLITSPNNDEGKSLLAANLAITIANSGAKVLLVDANFINPKLNKLFNIHSSPSLAHYLLKKKELDNIIRTTQTPNLSIITSVELIQNAGTIMKSERMKEFVKIVNNKFDFVIYDSASLSSLKETVTIAKLVTQTILVARANKTQLSSINEAIAMLKNNGINNLGVVLNDTEL